MYVNAVNKPISIRDLQKMSAKAIEALDGPTPVKAGDRTVGALFPLKKADPKKLRAVLLEAEAWAKTRDAKADDAALERYGPVDKTDWSFAAMKRAKTQTKRKR